ncbi:hypothetical protein CBR_g52620 [Chara braunii]|uniref:DUF659 domain-containing protein n=1 Tax=Chara braunii TaxID=69332 RepID=A0A388MAI6_CHABU|nr:hypothetical protein CBR_g52620 [Chara braunii]|eukprot:GBG91584.1 hypothetical protein CBR_g52620 [Chara braunii]
MNFLAAREQEAVLVAPLTMTARKKNALVSARLWEHVMREIGLKCINGICTDNALVNKKAVEILELHKDKEVARIPWVPCGAHCCSLLLKDLTNPSWIKGTVNTSNTGNRDQRLFALSCCWKTGPVSLNLDPVKVKRFPPGHKLPTRSLL